jgi:uncharacterized cupredoxin-like copper-binding protein
MCDCYNAATLNQERSMRKIILILITAAMLFLSACAGSAAVQPTPTAGSVSAGSSGADQTQITVTLQDNTISASQTSFKAGVLYTFVITNQGNHTHNFNISTPVSAAGSYSNAQATALLSVPEEKLRPGSTVTEQYTFQDSAMGTQLEFSCLIQRHYEDGMKLAITVTK